MDSSCQGKRPGQEYSRMGRDVEWDAIEASMETNRWWHNETNSRYNNAVEWRGMHAKCTACLNGERREVRPDPHPFLLDPDAFPPTELPPPS